MKKRKLSLALALVMALSLLPAGVLAADPSEQTPQPQTVIPRTTGAEDGTPNANYGKAYETAGLTLGTQAGDGSYTLTIDRAKLEAVAKAGTAASPDTGNELYQAYQTMENQNNSGRLWFGMEYPAPTVSSGTIKSASVKFDDAGDFAPADAFTDGSGAVSGIYNYIKVYEPGVDGNAGTIGPVEGEIAEIQWLDEDDEVLAATKADVRVEVKEADPSDPSKTEYTITFESNGGTAVAAVKVESGRTAAEPAAPTKEDFTFDGWYKDPGLTQRFDFSTAITENITLYARWKADDGDPDDPNQPDDPDTPEKYTVTFNSNGGSEVGAVEVETGKTVTAPASPTKEGYTFEGWYEDSGLTKKFDFSTVITKDITLYAKWTEKPSTPGTSDEDEDEYEVRIYSDIRHGSVYTSHEYAGPGTRVTVTVYPDTDYTVNWVEVEREDGRSLYLSQNGRRYTFTMPASDVMVDARFSLRDVYRYTVYLPEEPVQTAAVPSVPSPAWRSAVSMEDVPAYSWAYPAAQWAYQNGYLDTAYDGTFRLNGPVSHQQMWKIMAHWMGTPVADERSAVNWAVQNGASRGRLPASAMTRQNVVEYLYQCCFLLGADMSATGNLGNYCDSQLITSTTAQNAWIWAVNKGIISGTSDGYLNPEKAVNRGEFAVILMRLFQNVMQ